MSLRAAQRSLERECKNMSMTLRSVQKSIPRNIQADRLIPCPVCKARVSKACKPCTDKKETLEEGQSHFGRRLKRIFTEGTLPEERL